VVFVASDNPKLKMYDCGVKNALRLKGNKRKLLKLAKLTVQ